MDNTKDLPGYKYYVDAHTGERPAVYVAFLDLAEGAGTVNGVELELDDERLAELDARERNYERRVVRNDPLTYAYFGTTAARRRFAAGPTFIARAYLASVRAGFEQLGEREAAAFAASTDAPPVPIRDLERIDLPPA